MNPSLFQVNTRVFIRQLGAQMGRAATLDDIPDSYLERLKDQKFDWIWFLGVWRTGEAGRRISQANPAWQHEFREVLPDLQPSDICGSCFAITAYTANPALGGPTALQRLRQRMQKMGLQLMLDFVPNHTATDHLWVIDHPDYYIAGTEQDLGDTPQNYGRTPIGDPRILAYGRDPYFPGWPDTFQLNYGASQVQEAMTNELLSVAQFCDGVRCDMAMLLLPEVFEKTWKIPSKPFWPQAIERVRSAHRGFTFLAEVYWGLEWTLQQQGFDYTYDKRLYDRLVKGQAQPVRDHLRADPEFQKKSARFLENHDEARAATVFPDPKCRAAAVITYLVTGLRFFQQGQMEGFRERIPVHLCRGPAEAVDAKLSAFYERLDGVVALNVTRSGNWRLLDCLPAWNGNPTADCFLCFSWQYGSRRLVAAVNYAPHQSQCYVKLPFPEIAGRTARLRDLLGTDIYDRSGDDLLGRGLYLDVGPWAHKVFELSNV